MPELSAGFAAPLPANLVEAKTRGWDVLDVILVTGDAHVDHPSFPAALLGRTLEAAGYRVGIIARPDVRDTAAFTRLGIPRLFFGLTAGSLDSMVGNYTAQKRRRSDDPYAPGGKAGGRPDRALTVYGNLLRRAFGKAVFLVAGGLEASLRRFAHYDYWSDAVRRPILMDCGADILVHGMGEGPIVEIARRLERLLIDRPALAEARQAARTVEPALQVAVLCDIPGVVYRVPKNRPEPAEALALPSTEDVAADPFAHARAHRLMELNRHRVIWQNCAGMRVIANPPWPSPTTEELDRLYALPFTRNVHSSIGDRVPALEQVRFSVTAHRGCFGGCAFCAIGAHQGKAISSRSVNSILDEIRRIVAHPDFRGTLADVGGPSANMYGLGCRREKTCDRPSCLWPTMCPDLQTDQEPYRRLLQAAAAIPGVKHLFVATGVRTDLAVTSEDFVRELVDRTGGELKVAPEHCVGNVLALMRKPAAESFLAFLKMHRSFSRETGRRQFVLPYLMAAHPGCGMEEMMQLHRFMKEHHLKAEQCQLFTPTPGTAATVMYATGLNPETLQPVFVERDPRRREMQKALILHHLPAAAALRDEALAVIANAGNQSRREDGQ